MRVLSVGLLLGLSLLCVASGTVDGATPAAHGHHTTVESIPAQPHGWKQLGRADPSATMRLLIAVHQENLVELEQSLIAVSTPNSGEYGKHWSNAAIHALVAPKKENVQAIKQWLTSHSIDLSTLESTSNEDFLRVRVTVAQAEKLLHAEYYEFAHENRKDTMIRTLHYKVPSSIAPMIDIIGPTVRFPSVTKPRPLSIEERLRTDRQRVAAKNEKKKQKKLLRQKQAPSVGPDPSICLAGPSTLSTTPACLRALYAVGTYAATVGTNSSVGVSAFEGQYFASSDLAQFFQTYDSTHARTAITVGQNVDDPTQAGTESSLDIQYSMAMAPNVPGTFWYDNTTDPIDFNLDFLYQLAAAEEVPYVISDSYGVDEEAHTGPAMDRFSVEFQKAGLRGVSMLFAMGDGGVGGGAYPALTNCTVFIPAFPTSPWVTTVGGTDGYQPEAAWVGSSGGFSNYYAAPSYQTADISNYFTTYASSLPTAGLYNTTGRGFPDVAFQSTNFPIVQGGQVGTVGGTSAASPSFAGLVALLNDARLQAGKSTLGFLNIAFYQNPSMFQDITTGNNPGCNANGFYAEKGWDPVTGLGTPNFPLMLKWALSLP